MIKFEPKVTMNYIPAEDSIFGMDSIKIESPDGGYHSVVDLVVGRTEDELLEILKQKKDVNQVWKD